MDHNNDGRNIDLEWENRVLCSDESCIGTIGADQCCRECGKPYEGDLPAGFDTTEGYTENALFAPPDDDVLGGSDKEDIVDGDGDQATPTDDEWARRRLCSDESCIGVIDESTGRCKECDKPLHET
jgi:hypothetical protein